MKMRIRLIYKNLRSGETGQHLRTSVQERQIYRKKLNDIGVTNNNSPNKHEMIKPLPKLVSSKFSLICKNCSSQYPLVRQVRRLYTLYKKEFCVTPFCSLKINLPYNVTIVPLDFFKYPNCDRVNISVEAHENVDCQINCSSQEDVINVNSSLKENLHLFSCKIEAPVKADIHASLENGNIDIANFHGNIINLRTRNGNISAGTCVCEKIVMASSAGSINCKNMLQAAHISLSTGEHGNICTEKLQGLTLIAKTINGNISTKSTYCDNSSFSTEGGNLLLSNTHKNCTVKCTNQGRVRMTGFDGTLQASIERGNVNIDVVRIEGNSKITIEKEGMLTLKLTEECVENTIFKLFCKGVDISPDLNVTVDIKANHKIMKAGEAKTQAEIECPHSNVVITNLSWREMFNV
ncbi:hypothetical protein FQR65_LT04090 [Abscondita terminalis]|nr:hypothetical protein FQR65_LT04090 [Abscondita terminalis]